jgi:hypothetical protein
MPDRNSGFGVLCQALHFKYDLPLVGKLRFIDIRNNAQRVFIINFL